MVYGHCYHAPISSLSGKEKGKIGKTYRIKILSSACVFASWKGGLSEQSSYIRQPSDHMSDFES